MEKVKLLLDTDIGTDVDDAVCLAYLLSHPRCELLGITTVTGEAEKRAMLASALCMRAGRGDVPIFPGAETPLLLSQRQTAAQQAEMLSKWPHETKFPRGQAIEFLRRTIRENPGEVTLLTIAPLTNIALLFSIDPEIPRLLKGLVMMCGRYLEPLPQGYGPLEWNALCDAHATEIVFRSPVTRLRALGLDVTSRVLMKPDEFRQAFKDLPLFAPVLDFAEVWFRDWPATVFHDPLAAAAIFDESFLTFERGSVSVSLEENEDERGRTLWVPDAANGPHEIAVDVQPEKYFAHYLDIVKGRA